MKEVEKRRKRGFAIGESDEVRKEEIRKKEEKREARDMENRINKVMDLSIYSVDQMLTNYCWLLQIMSLPVWHVTDSAPSIHLFTSRSYSPLLCVLPSFPAFFATPLTGQSYAAVILYLCLCPHSLFVFFFLSSAPTYACHTLPASAPLRATTVTVAVRPRRHTHASPSSSTWSLSFTHLCSSSSPVRSCF
jgi:hypothetical protein